MNNCSNIRCRKFLFMRLLRIADHLLRLQTIWCVLQSIWYVCKASVTRCKPSGTIAKHLVRAASIWHACKPPVAGCKVSVAFGKASVTNANRFVAIYFGSQRTWKPHGSYPFHLFSFSPFHLLSFLLHIFIEKIGDERVKFEPVFQF